MEERKRGGRRTWRESERKKTRGRKGKGEVGEHGGKVKGRN